MKTLVMKFGGASVETPAHFSKIAQLVDSKKREFDGVVCVVSAMGNTTDQLISLAKQVNPKPPQREHDMLVTVGERISTSLLAMALSAIGREAVSYTGSQSGIMTCTRHAEARIIDVRPRRIRASLEQGKVVTVAGFQGVSLEGEITTLGRGGSDTTAVALGIALGAEKVEFYKDVEGVYAEDPKMNPSSNLYERLSYREAMEIVGKGSEVLHSRCIELARHNRLPLHVRSFINPGAGTMIFDAESAIPESPIYEPVHEDQVIPAG